MKLGSIRTFAEILKSGSAISNLLLSLHCPFKNFFLFFDANYLDRQHSKRAHGERKVAQQKRQQFISLDSQSIRLLSSKSSVRSRNAAHVIQNSSAQVARSVAAIWALLLFKCSQIQLRLPTPQEKKSYHAHQVSRARTVLLLRCAPYQP